MESVVEILRQFKQLIIDIPSITINDIIDIAAVSFIIYKVTSWIKDTRAWSLFKGILIICMMYAFAILVKLNTLLWILANTISVGIIAIIVVFQPEFRRALEKLGTGNFMSRIFSMDDTYAKKNILSLDELDEIVDAVKQMSQKLTGALIVLEQKVRLGEYEETGISIDAKVKGELIINIFEKNTPLHDGAIIIRNNKITSTTCYLPLSANDSVSKKLGTRHRAALGITEVSDCVVIVVSEETGSISIVKDGQITYDIKRENIRNQLITELKRIPLNPLKKITIWGGRGKDEKETN